MIWKLAVDVIVSVGWLITLIKLSGIKQRVATQLIEISEGQMAVQQNERLQW